MIMEDQETWIKFMDINLYLGEIQHTLRFSKQKPTVTLFNRLTFEIKIGIKALRVILKIFWCLYDVPNFLKLANKFNLAKKIIFQLRDWSQFLHRSNFNPILDAWTNFVKSNYFLTSLILVVIFFLNICLLKLILGPCFVENQFPKWEK